MPQLIIHTAIDEIEASAWNRLITDGDPFLHHAFLAALERHHCVGDQFGWHPCHLAYYESGALVAALPLYAKDNSYGELVFDHVWAQAYERHGLRYFPKLVSAIPYTPATGRRLLCQAGDEAHYWPLLATAAQQLAREQGMSGWHCLFPTATEANALSERGLLLRHDCQFHWHNRDYADFSAFLAALSSKKRKNILRERRRVTAAGITFRHLNGHQASALDWHHFARFYRNTFAEKWGVATFNEGFFREVAATLPDQILLILADDREGQPIAGALCYRSETTLYGRHWGCDEKLPDLHFETCYYQGIEYAITHQLQRFEPGAQGEHKLARGFLPTVTRSIHALIDSPLQPAIADFVARERRGIADYIEHLEASTPYAK